MLVQQCFDFVKRSREVSPHHLCVPEGYKGLYGFHKYWGKKPHEPLAYAIERLTQEGDIVADPFVGSGTAARETLLHARRFIGFDINPLAIELSRFLVHPPSVVLFRQAVRTIEKEVKAKIFESYLLKNADAVATHYLWEGDQMRRVWVIGKGAQTGALNTTPANTISHYRVRSQTTGVGLRVRRASSTTRGSTPRLRSRSRT